MEVPREFYKKHINELVRYISAVMDKEMVFLTFVRGQKQITIQFKRNEFDSLHPLTMIEEIVGPLSMLEGDQIDLRLVRKKY